MISDPGGGLLDLLNNTYFSAQYMKKIPMRASTLMTGINETKKAVNTTVLIAYTY